MNEIADRFALHFDNTTFWIEMQEKTNRNHLIEMFLGYDAKETMFVIRQIDPDTRRVCFRCIF